MARTTNRRGNESADPGPSSDRALGKGHKADPVRRVTQETQETQNYEESKREQKRNNEPEFSRKLYQRFVHELESGQPTSLSLSEFIQAAHTYHEANQISTYDDFKTPLWTFVRTLTAHPELFGLSANDAFDIIEEELSRWSGADIGEIWETAFPEIYSDEDAYAEFVSAWNGVKFRPGCDFVVAAFESAQKHSFPAFQGKRKGYRDFLELAASLQLLAGNQAIYLPVRKCAEVLSLQPMTISRYRRWAETEGLLKVVKQHSFRSNGPSKATEYRFSLEALDRSEDQLRGAEDDTFEAIFHKNQTKGA